MIITNNIYTIFDNIDEAIERWDDFDSKIKIWIEGDKLKTTNSNGKQVNLTKKHLSSFENSDELLKEIKSHLKFQKPKQTLKEFNDLQILRNKFIHCELYSEKNTDSLMMEFYKNLFVKLFGYERLYFTKVNKEIADFNGKIPDGYDIIDDILIIIENKKSENLLSQACEQIENYKNSVKEKFNKIYLIIGTGTTKENFKIHFFKSTTKKEISKDDFIEELKKIKTCNNLFDIHMLNQFLYDENINLGDAHEKIKILCELYKISRKIKNIDLFDIDDNLIKIIKTELETYNSYYTQIVKYFVNNRKNISENIINEIFNEILIYSEEHELTNDEGTVITPLYISELMSQVIKDVENVVVYDPCCGNGALEIPLINKAKFYLNELDKNRVELTKMFMNFNNVKYEITNKNAFNIDLPDDVNFIVMNPPYKFDDDKTKLTNKLEINMIIDMIEKAKKLKHAVYLSAIIPTNDYKNQKFLDYLRENTTIIHTIKLNKDAFEPMADVDTSIISLIINTTKTDIFKCYNAINDNASIINRGKKMKRIVHKINLEELENVEININNKFFVNLFNNDFNLNYDELNKMYNENIKGIVKALLMNKYLDKKQNLKLQCEKIKSKEQDLNQQIYNKYKDLLNVEDKILLFIMFKLNLDFEQKLLPFEKYLDCKFKDFDDTDYLMNLYINLIAKINIEDIKNIINIFDEKFDIEAFFEDIAKHAVHKQTNSKDGIVFTNKIIVDNMIKSLKITENDDFLDFCCGSGNFPIAASKYNPKTITGIEISKLTSTLAKLLLQTKNQNYKIICDNAFDNAYISTKLFDKIAINPPYNCVLDDKGKIACFTKSDIPEKFIVYGIDKLKEGGLLTAVVPGSCFKNNKLMDYIRKTCEVIEIITYDSEMFKESDVKCYVSSILLKKVKEPKTTTFVCSLFDKGYNIIHNIKNIYSEPKIIKSVEKSIDDTNWNFIDENDLIINDTFIETLKNNIITSSIENYVHNIITENIYEDLEFETVKLSDVFKIVNIKNYPITDKENIYSLIGAGKINNGFSNTCNGYRFKNLYTIAKTGNGGAGYMFYHPYKFNKTSSALVVEPLINLSPLINCPLISLQLHKQFDRSNSITEDNFNDIKIQICKSFIPKLNKFMNSLINNFTLPNLNLQREKFIKIKLGHVFKQVKKIKNYKYSTRETENSGNIPLFACKKLDRGIARYVDNYEYEGNVLVVVHHRDATCGYTFHHNGKLAWNNSCYVIEQIEDKLNLDITAELLTLQISPCHLESESFSCSELLDREIYVYQK